MKRLRFAASLVGGVSLLATASPACAEQSLVQSQAAAPPELQLLEQRMEQLHVKSERFGISISMYLKLAKGLGFPFIIGGTGLVSVSPGEAIMTVGLPGAEEEFRTIGNVTYRYEKSIAEYDGGRPWVRSTGKTLQSTIGAPIDTVEEPESPGASTFARLIKTIGEAESYVQVGPQVVNGQQASEFEIALKPTTALSGLAGTVTSSANEPHVTSLKLDVFIAPDGLPLRTIVIAGLGSQSLTVTLDVLATEVPVLVTAPPARKTIADAKLEALKKKRERDCARRVREQARHKHGGPAVCEVEASRAPGTRAEK